MDNRQQGAELNQLSRVLFNQAAKYWQASIVLEFVVGVVSIIVVLIGLSLRLSIVWAVIVVIALFIAHYLKYKFDVAYDIAETMRRQSVMSEGLNWPIERAQFNEWKSRAGTKVLADFAVQQRAEDYYETQSDYGPKKLAEMVFESAFWTKNLYKKLKTYLGIILACSLVILFLLLTAPVFLGEGNSGIYLIYAAYLLIPVILSVDLVGLFLRSGRNVQALFDIERDLGAICERQGDVDVAEVMRLTSEYNCISSSAGMPIPNWVFNLHHDEIQQYWDKLSN